MSDFALPRVDVSTRARSLSRRLRPIACLVVSSVLALACDPARERSLPPCTALAPDGGVSAAAGDGGQGSPVILAAGDIAGCDEANRAEQTASILDQEDGTVLLLGDNAYDTGTLDDYLDCYEPTWGRHRWRTRPSPGNHDYRTPHAAAYFAYFCKAAGPSFRGYYSFDLGEWHIVSLNSNCDEYPRDVTCDEDAEQNRWLRDDLAAHPARCTLAYWHHPRFSSGHHGNATNMSPIWQTLYDAHVDVVLNGHDHDYERFAPQSPSGAADPERGIREFVVGTGGRDQRWFEVIQANSEARTTGVFGVLKLTLNPTSYDWRFIAIAGQRYSDEGSTECH